MSNPGNSEKFQTRGNRYTPYDDGDGDVRIYQIMSPDGEIPGGALLPIPDVPGFLTKSAAVRFLKANPDQFRSMQLKIIRTLEILALQIHPNPQVSINFKSKKKLE